jgi:hypothetical protein
VSTAAVTLAIACRADEPALGRTLAAAAASWRASEQAATHALEVLVCVNGDEARAPLEAVRAFAGALGAAAREIDLDGEETTTPPATPPLSVVTLRTRRVGKPLAWNALRQAARAPVAIFLDADVTFGAEAFSRLLGALAAHPRAVLASGRTVCAPRRGAFEGIMAAPYAVDFPNLSPQLYAARLELLPGALPLELLDQEHWLELFLGADAIVRVPEVRVAVRLPATLADFFRQRIRIEMGKVQLARRYPELAGRGAPQPGLGAAVARLGPLGTGRLLVYLGLRSAAHAIAWWRYRRGDTAEVWRQARTTKQWDPA